MDACEMRGNTAQIRAENDDLHWRIHVKKRGGIR